MSCRQDQLHQSQEEGCNSTYEEEGGIVLEAIGAVRKVDTLNRVVIPKDICQAMNISPGDHMEVFTDAGTIVFRKYQPGCHFCNSMNNLTTYKGEKICRYCLQDMKGLR
jgi:transcriptional pleiotropic regulator of transition state genes